MLFYTDFVWTNAIHKRNISYPMSLLSLTLFLSYGDNTKAAIIRLGLVEMKLFAKHFYEGVEETTFFESCGLADLVTSCYGGRNRKVAEAFVRTRKVHCLLHYFFLDKFWPDFVEKSLSQKCSHKINLHATSVVFEPCIRDCQVHVIIPLLE